MPLLAKIQSRPTTNLSDTLHGCPETPPMTSPRAISIYSRRFEGRLLGGSAIAGMIGKRAESSV
jgi:hypothetical protein